MRRWTEEDLKRLGHPLSAAAVNASVNKYGARHTVVDGIRFDSKLESKLYQELKLRISAGEIRFVLRQVAFELEGGVKYRADFMAVLPAAEPEFWDAKGMDTPVSELKRKQVKARYGVDVKVWTGK